VRLSGGATLPAYVKKPVEITDGHLLALAKHHGARLVTFDAGIPGALSLP
jgi:predicted nucleic acid-binding protein